MPLHGVRCMFFRYVSLSIVEARERGRVETRGQVKYYNTKTESTLVHRPRYIECHSCYRRRALVIYAGARAKIGLSPFPTSLSLSRSLLLLKASHLKARKILEGGRFFFFFFFIPFFFSLFDFFCWEKRCYSHNAWMRFEWRTNEFVLYVFFFLLLLLSFLLANGKAN